MPDDTRLSQPALPPCPICGAAPEGKWRPFCSRRCADLDLGRWMTGVYAVPVEEESPGAAVTDEG